MIPRTAATAACLAFVLAANPAAAAATQVIGYSLSAGSEFRTGCFEPPCACGPVQNSMTGTFALIRQPPTPPFTSYDVVGVHWVVQFPVGLVTITGAGTYRVGGSGTVKQRLALDLVIGGGPVRHFDSGLVPGGTDFPRIEVPISLYGGIACGDTTLFVRAGPDGGTLGADTPVLALAPLAPNPFGGATRLAFATREEGPVRVTVHDPAGRCVRTLADRDWLTAGDHVVEWDGRGEDGRRTRPGLYFLLVQAAGTSRRTSVIKLR